MIYLSYIATTLVLLAVYYISKPKLRGQYLILCADITWLIFSLGTENYALAIQSFILMCIAISAIKNWTKEGIEL